MKKEKKDEHEMSTEQCTLFNSSIAYAEGYDRVSCTCGWKSKPVKAKDAVAMFGIHVTQAMTK